MKYIKYTILLILCTLHLYGQTTYTASKYKQVWYVSGTEKTHATFAAYDTSSLLISNTSNVPTITQLSATGTTLFKLDETGTFSNYAGSTTLPWLLKTTFDDSLNNAHTITSTWRFTNDLIPTTNGGSDLGQTSLRFDSVYAAVYGNGANDVVVGQTGNDITLNADTVKTIGYLRNSNIKYNEFLFYDDFNRANTANGTLGTSPGGYVWDLRTSYVDGYPLPAATKGKIRETHFVIDGGTNVYATQTFTYPITHIGGRVSYEVGNGGSQEAVQTLIISKDNNFISSMLHFYMCPTNWSFQIRQDGGDFITLQQGTFSPTLSKDGTSYPFEMILSGNQVTLSLAGKTISITDKRINDLIGQYCAWQITTMGETSVASYGRWDAVWAGTSTMTQNAFNKPDTLLYLSMDTNATKDSTLMVLPGIRLKNPNGNIYIDSNGGTYSFTSNALVSGDGYYLGSTAVPWQGANLYDVLRIGGKGRTAELIIGTQKIMTEKADSTQVLTMLNGNPINYYYASDGDAYTQSINTSDQAVFAGASGGYDFDAPIVLSDGVTAGAAAFCTNAVKDTVAIAGALSTDIYHFDWTSDPGSPGAHWYEAYVGGVYFYTDAATTGNPSYTWTRWGKN